jgi:acyl transferase domain-containing protein
VIQAALSAAGRRPEDISFVETHGTGTALGDPIEVRSLRNVLMRERPKDHPCWLGAVKTNIGHLESAAGIAGLQKLILAIQHQQIPPNLHFHKLNPYISLDGTSFRLPTECTAWETADGRRVAGISSFGFGGTNCHVVVEQAPVQTPRPHAQDRTAHVHTLSAKSNQA